VVKAERVEPTIKPGALRLSGRSRCARGRFKTGRQAVAAAALEAHSTAPAATLI
jgi:hypothetical protein